MPDLRELYQEVFDPAWHPGSCRMRPGSNLALTWITAQHKPRHRSIEKESDRPQLAEKTQDSGAGPETFARTVRKPVASRSALA